MLIVVTLAETGGAQSYVAHLARAMADSYEVTVAAHGPGPLAATVTAAGAEFVALRHVRRPISPLTDLRGLVEMWRLCRRLRPQLIHLNSAKAGILGRIAAVLAGVPVRIYTVHGWAFKVPGTKASTFYRFAERLLRPLATLVICVSETERTAGLLAHTCAPRKTVVIHNAVSVDHFATREHHVPDFVCVTSVGRLAPPKDFRTLLQAVASIRRSGIRLVLVGDGPERRELEDMAGHLGITDIVEFVGEVDDVPDRLARTDIFVLSSHSEGLPISVLEAMAAGLPVVATDVGGMVELVEDGITGFLVGPGDVSALARRIDELAADVHLRRSMGHAGHERAIAMFDIRAWEEAHRRVYADVLERGLTAHTTA